MQTTINRFAYVDRLTTLEQSLIQRIRVVRRRNEIDVCAKDGLPTMRSHNRPLWPHTERHLGCFKSSTSFMLLPTLTTTPGVKPFTQRPMLLRASRSTFPILIVGTPLDSSRAFSARLSLGHISGTPCSSLYISCEDALFVYFHLCSEDFDLRR